MQLEINLPCELVVHDYHEFAQFAKFVTEQSGRKVQYKELGIAKTHGYAMYVGVLFVSMDEETRLFIQQTKDCYHIDCDT